jgi:phosphoglycolate phosphatase-like HAD superfamily hydrolase
MKNTRILGIDLDGVLRDFVSGLTSAYRAHYPGHEVEPVTDWDLHQFFPIGRDIYEFLWGDPEVTRMILEGAPPYDGAVEFVATLSGMEGVEIAIVTHQPSPCARMSAWEWLRHHGVLQHVDSVIILSGALTKGDIDGLDVLLDDYEKNLEMLGAETIPVCMARPWNEGNWSGLTVHSYGEFLRWVRGAA